MPMGDTMSNMKGPIRSALIVLAVFGLLVGLTLAGLPKGLMVAIAAGMLVVGLLILAWQFIIQMADRGKSGPFAKLIAGSASGGQIADPAMKARLDDLRKKFEEGIEKFRAAGKNLYAIPWYLLVGEPGSGKSFLVRKAGKTGNWFPPGLQDELQGTGGTINMHWWFTNYAVVVDTAGKMLMQEVKPGENSEWREFLKLLKLARPNCPVNGLLLVIPADTLIKDRPEQIEKKAGTIARQLDMIQRTLDVRFPVFVIITKCDLITGFRDFFEVIDDATAQHQILGWSNPADLDAVFNPDEVDQHMAEVRDRLMRRRAGMMLDPVHTENPKARRLDQLDSLFALPESLMKLSPRLRRYLEMVFVAGEWSPKPLFLRGIYFTSSVQEGSELDEMLADALGIPIDAITPLTPDEKEKALFLRDVFSQKIFREKGLVTSASNVKKQQRRRRLAVLGGALVTTLVFVGLTFLGATQLSGRIDGPRKFWQDVARRASGAESGSRLGLLEGSAKGLLYRGDKQVELVDSGRTVRLGELPRQTQEQAGKTIAIPAAFRPLSAILGDVSGNLRAAERAEAHAGLTVANALVPAVDAARAKLADPNLEWDASASAALAELLRLERDAALASGAKGVPLPERASVVDLDRLYRFVLSDEEYGKFLLDKESLQKALDYSFVASDGPRLAWPPPAVGAGTEPARLAIAAGLRRFNETGGATRTAVKFPLLVELRGALEELRDAEAALLKLDDAYRGEATEPRTRSAYQEAAGGWNGAIGKVAQARDRVLKVVETLGGSNLPSTKELCAQARDEMTKAAEATYETILAPLKEGQAALNSSGTLGPIMGTFKNLASAQAEVPAQIAAKADELDRALGTLEPDFLAKLQGDQTRLFDARYRMYALATDQLKEPEQAGADPLGSIDAASQAIDQMARASGRNARTDEAAELARFALRLARRDRLYVAINGALETLPAGEEQTTRAIAERAAKLRRLERPTIELTAQPAQFAPEFHPEAAKSILAGVATARAQLAGSGGAKVLEADALSARMGQIVPGVEAYARKYVAYWSAQVFAEARPSAFADWEKARRGVSGVGVFPVNDALARLGETAAEALKALPAGYQACAERDARVPEIEAARAALTTELTGTIQDAIDNGWNKLPADVRGARDAIVTLTAEEFERRYLPAYTESAPGAATYGTGYWSALYLEAFKSLAAGANASARDAMERLRAECAKFPIVRDGRESMTPEQLTSGADDLALLIGPTPLAASGERSIRAGDRSKRFRQIDEQLDLLTGENILVPDVRTWVKKLTPMFAYFTGDQRLRLVEISLPDASQKREAPARAPELLPGEGRFKFVELAPGQGIEPKGRKQTGFNAGALGSAEIGTSGPLKFRVYLSERDKAPAAEASIGEPAAGGWAPITAAFTEDAVAGSDARTWLVPLRIEQNKKQYYLWVQLRFSRELPRPEEWLTESAWPR
jgi:hypothetical protein